MPLILPSYKSVPCFLVSHICLFSILPGFGGPRDAADEWTSEDGWVQVLQRPRLLAELIASPDGHLESPPLTDVALVMSSSRARR